MATVRRSSQHNLVIKPHRPERLALLLGAAFILLIVAVTISFSVGRTYQDNRSHSDQRVQQLVESKARLIGLEQQIMVEQLAIENARQSLSDREEQIRQLNKVIAFYRGIMAPEKAITGLQVQNLNIESLEAANSYRLGWILMQIGNNKQLMQGDVELRVSGRMKGIIDNTAVGEGDVVVVKIFKFRYFQDFEVDIFLPDQFQPAQVQVTAVSRGKNSQKIIGKFKWIVRRVE